SVSQHAACCSVGTVALMTARSPASEMRYEDAELPLGSPLASLVSLTRWLRLLRFAGIGCYLQPLPGGVLGDGNRRGTEGHEPRKRPCGTAGPASNRRRREPSCPSQAICSSKSCAIATTRRSRRS